MAEEQQQQLESSGSNLPPAAVFGLEESILTVLPADPFEQLDVARKITSIALASRVSSLESEVSSLRRSAARKDDRIAELSARVEALDASLADLSRALAKTVEEKEALLSDNVSLSNTVSKLNRDVSKLEVFKKTLMQSLTEEDENSQGGASKVVQKKVGASTEAVIGDDDATPPPLKSSSANQVLETGSSISDDGVSNDTDAFKLGMQPNLHIPSLSSTPMLTPPDSPPRLSAAFSQRRLSTPTSPRRHSIAISSTRSMLDERSSIFSSTPSGHRSTMTSPFDTGAQTGRTRVDGKEFFRQVRSRLSYEQFSSFLANVKELNSHKQTREETLRKAEEIFGPDNKDLYAIFEGLITRNLH